MRELYPPIEPYEKGMLEVGDGNSVYWEVCGNPAGKPALVVHGGPGSGCGTSVRRFFDPARYRIVLFDQRGCGRSTPHASDPAADMRHNTTPHLIADMERLRHHLGIDRWLLYGGSWGSTLILAYAEQHPERVSEIVISSVTTTRRSEIEWLYRGAGRFFPEQWERFLAGAPGTPRDGDVVAAYARLMEHPDAAVRNRATADWCAWEDAVLSGETHGASNPYGGRPPAARLALVRICSHYFSHGAWLEEGVLLREAGRLAGIPGVLVHGRLDMAGPLDTAWELSRSWPGAELIVVEDAGHLGSTTTHDHVLQALDRFAANP
ncbi:prolyl aminopeptidase [Streptomyces spectabilis]|uniref:Proline iminopeptidase n=1 Tax=Streptomyces spectabilis TaxID=68270 RepID=A0A5P2X0A8_STRST|nr:prolyl aminopeptidase [Streptomyces spectabilis]MBB5101062.1 proline iminopeptidase [Streptomyces spectabilis]MCI3900271.1 prolyl aminopeptidase [Streptomyces spectabilis]QEV57871.1 prolyl aminopeptidase [Streptomyces spectabilis]GGV09135.1 proline iminopeptidase [Streptomyces spectabilis]